MRRFSQNNKLRHFAACSLVVAILLPMMAFAQTKIVAPKNKRKIQDDIKIGRDTAGQAEQIFPLIPDATSNAYLQDVGRRLVDAIPSEYQHSEFQYYFKIINASDINAFALPGGPMYVNRGMIVGAKNEGEMAGVMAHELSHVALRHGTAQGPGILTQIGAIGAIIGGGVVGAPEIGQIAAAGLITPNSRAHEKQADILGAQIMARAGYDPRDLANIFKTIAGENGGQRSPEFISTHPDPGNRYGYINQEATQLRVSPNPIKITSGFQRTQRYMNSLPPAQTMQQIEAAAQKGQTQGGGEQDPMAGGKYSQNVPAPSPSYRAYNAGKIISLQVPTNWKEFPRSQQQEVWFSPDGAWGAQGITHGSIMGVEKNTDNLQTATKNYVDGILKANTYLKQNGNYSTGKLSGRAAYAVTISGTSDVTGKVEVDTIYTTLLSDGSLLYIVTVVPQDQSSAYKNAFSSILKSLQINDK